MQVKHLEQAMSELAGPNWKVERFVCFLHAGFQSDEEDVSNRITLRSQLYLQDD